MSLSLALHPDRCAPGRKVIKGMLLALLTLAVTGCPQRSPERILPSNLRAPEGAPAVLAVYEPWFGQPDHLNVGYSSHDPAVIAKQIRQAQNLGISGFVVDWYGSGKTFIDQTYSLLQQTASQQNFHTALMYDESADSDDPTSTAIAALDYAYDHYIGPDSSSQQAYLTYDGRPVIFVWPRNKQTDWKQIREHLSSWKQPPLLIYEDSNSPYASQFDGFYAWAKPGKAGWAADGSNWGEQYLDSFYRKMKTQYPDKIAVGAAWPGFNDSHAAWSLNRRMDPRCGQTFEDSLRLYRRYYSSSNPLPFLLIVTWNDYEEGTAIERGLQKCNG